MRALIATLCLAPSFVILGWVHKSTQEHLRFDPPSVTSTAQALYPPHSVASGTVILEVGLDTEGKISDVRVVHDIPSLTESAQQSLRQWKFQPAILDGGPVKSKVTVAFTFSSANLGPSIQHH